MFAKIISFILGPTFAFSAVVFAESTFPKEVRDYLSKRSTCDHWRLEPYPENNKARADDISKGIRENCVGTDKQLQDLKKKYAKDNETLKKLSAIQENIEKDLVY